MKLPVTPHAHFSNWLKTAKATQIPKPILAGAMSCMVALVFFFGVNASAFASASVTTDQEFYYPGDMALINGSTFMPGEQVTLVVTLLDGTPLSGIPGQPWVVSADQSGDFQSSWYTSYDHIGDTLLLTAEGNTSGYTAATSFLVPSQNLDQLHNGTGFSSPEWANGNINSNNSCYAEGNSVPYRYFISNESAGTSHYFTIEMEWTKGSIHAMDYLTSYDLSEATPIASAGGPCGNINTPAPSDCGVFSDSLLFPDPTITSNYTGSIPSDFFTNVNPTFVVEGDRYLKAYNCTIDSVGKYFFGGTSSDRTLAVKVYFTLDSTGSVGMYWGGHLASSAPSAWGAGNGSASVGGAPYHMRAQEFDGGGGGGQDRSIQNGVICMPPGVDIICSQDSVCADGSTIYVCRDTSSVSNHWTWSVTNGTIIGSSTADSVRFTVNSSLDPGDSVYISVESCDTTGGCPGDFCCATDEEAIPVGLCNTPPSVSCATPSNVFLCAPEEVCVYPFTVTDAEGNVASETVSLGTLVGDTVCFTPDTAGVYTIRYIATDSYGAADTCETTVTVSYNVGPVAMCPGDTSINTGNLDPICLTGFTYSDADGNVQSVSVSPGTLSGDSVCFTPVSGANQITLIVTDSCGVADTCVTNVNVMVNTPPVCPPSTLDTSFFLCASTQISLPIEVTDAENNLTGCSILSGPGSIVGDSLWTYTPTSSGTDTVTIECTDSFGATCSFYFIVNVTLNSAPTVNCPSNTSLFVCDLSQICISGFSASDVDGNLTSVTVSNGVLSGDSVCFTPVAGANVITLIATDACGAADTCVTTVTVTVNSAPVASCPGNSSFTLCGPEQICVGPFGASDVNGNLQSQTFSFGSVSGSDICFTPDTAGAYTITQIITDSCGAADTCSVQVTVNYTTKPSISNESHNIALCAPGSVCYALPAVTGGAGPYSYTVDGSPADSVCFALNSDGVFNKTVIVTDSCGKADTATFTVNAMVNTAPVITGVDNAAQFICDAGGTVCVKVSIDDPGNGLSGVSQLGTYNPADSTVCFTADTSGNYCDQLIITDSCGLADTISYCIDVTVNSAPSVTCANDTSLFVCDLSQICLSGFSASDADGNLLSVVANGGTYSAGEICFTPVVGANVITFISTDSCGAADTCVTTVTVTLNSAPVATCPGNSSLTLCGPEQICVGPFSSSDADNNIDSESFSFGSPSGSNVCFTPDTAGVYTISYVVTDECGLADTCVTTVTVAYTTKPDIANQNKSIALCAPGSVCYALPAVTGGAGPYAYTVDGSPADSVCFTLSGDGVYNKTVIVTDSCGKADTATFTVNAMVNTAPVITGVDNVAQFICDAGGTVCVKVSIDDPGNGLSGVSQLGTYNPADSTVCFTADTSGNYCDQLIITDSCGLADTVNFCIDVTVNSAPSVTCANDTSLFVCDLSQICLPGFSASDANGNLLSVVANGGTYGAGEVCFTPVVGANVITFIATDSCGAADTCVTTVTVTLNSAPVATCPSSESFTLCGPEQICVGPFSSSDADNNIDNESFSFGSQSGDDICFTPDTAGVYSISYVVTDECGAADTCVTSVTVAYTTKPDIANQNKSIALCAPGSVCYALPAVTGGAGPYSYTVDGSPADSVCFTLSGDGVFNKTVIVTDSCGKADTATFTVNAMVNTAPVITGVDNAPQFACADDATICVKFTVDDPGNSISGSSQLGTVNMADSTVCFQISGAGQYCDQLIITDSCGLADTLEYCIDITSNSAPIAACPGNSSVFVCDLGSPLCIAGFSSSDVDGNITSVSVSTGTISNDTVCFTPVAGANVITYIVTDACGAADTCQTTITVTVNAPPVANCPGDANFTYCGPQQVCVSGFSSSDPNGNLQSSAVNFGTLNAGQVCFNADTAGVYTLIYSATDACGSVAACSTLVTVTFYAAPQFSGNVSENFGAVCDPGTYCVALPTVSGGNPPYTYNVTGAGTLSGDSVCFNLSVGNNSVNATAVVTDACGKKDTATISVTAMVNRPPQVTCPGPTVRNVCNVGALICVPGFNASDPDGNLDTVYAIGGNYSGGSVCFTPSSFGDYDITLVAIDECGIQTTCEVTVSVNMSSGTACDTCPTITIEKAHNVLQGHQVCISVTSEGSVKDISGYDFLIAYDNSALTALGANPGDHLTGCGWEYFTYRFGANGNCSNGCPSGLIRVVGLAETNNGGGHPICFGPTTTDPIELAEICFLVSNDRNLECQFAPVRFFWMDCGDNALTDKSGDTLFISDLVYDYGNPNPINNPGVGFPTYFGAQALCLNNDDPNKPSAISCVTFQNGGIDIICADSIDARGDLNLNGVANEIADAVMYSQYFVSGLAAFTIAPEGQIAASEVNADGIPLTVADLVYLIRVIVGDAMPIPKLDHGSKTVTVSQSDNNYVTIDHELGAALFVFDGYVEVTLVQSQMNLSIGLRDGKTYALVAPEISDGPMNETIHVGEVLIASAPLISVQAAEPNGAVTTVNLRSGTLPGEFTLHQNYPNPFNPATKIAFELPYATAYTLEVYNVAGQRVADFTGQGQGRVEVTWEASASASGMYLYKLTAGNFVSTRKMILLK